MQENCQEIVRKFSLFGLSCCYLIVSRGDKANEGFNQIGHKLAPGCAGSGVVEKNIEVRTDRRFQATGPRWTRNGAEHFAQVLWLRHHLRRLDPLLEQNRFN